ncbi:MAG TPA: DNA methyltransferase [Pirellulales bacterium]|nr:DNA methyltransferase [Pirellulales bacterium]
MKLDRAAVRKCLKSFDFPTLFREHLGWDKHQAQLDVAVDGNTVRLSAVAQKRGFVAYVCPCAKIPDRPTRLKIDQQVTRSAREHFVIYADQPAGQQVWHWVRRETGKPLAGRDHRFDASQSGDPLIQRLEQIAIGIEQEEQLTLFEVTGKAKSAFDVDKVTKKFYERFKAEHATFLKFINGIEVEADLQWYTSLMLNRLMFVYFIQKKGFLDGDADYLRNRMRLVREAKGKDKFLSFYRYFLLRLFHDGLGKAPEERKLDRELETLLGKVPFLNGGFFEEHQLEQRHREIDIPDKAFEKLFDFFDDFRWHLDERPLRADNEINPDVVGYIFEKYINQKQMGAYYTKEDITEYISKNTVIPFLFDAAEKNCAKKCPIAFKPDSFLWRLLRDDPDRYIYPAVRHGVVDEGGNVVPLPKGIEAGINDVTRRENWNKPAAAPYGLPTETWREHVARRTRCLELREKLRRGEVHQINDLITLNLDLWQFARDTIVNSEGPELLRAFWQAIEKVTVLDPTCGSGAFLFAALRILETLYGDCLERMERFVEDLAGKNHHPEKFRDFKDVLAQIAKHPSDRYFILKSIIINNLFGVDIMEEAVEICKLRLFLKLVAQVETAEQIEPLPDIDFNIRSGNTLVGYVALEQVRKSQEGTLGFGAKEIERIEEDAVVVEKCFEQFRAQQTTHGGKVTAKDKQELRRRLQKLDGELDRYLAGEYGIAADTFKSKAAYDEAFAKWKAGHEPFHWFVEFYGIMANGGFDVVIGNPPYISASTVRTCYTLRSYETIKCTDIYANVQERSLSLLSSGARCGMIVPLSLSFSGDFQSLRTLLFRGYSCNWYSSFGRIPAALFSADVRVRNTIHLGVKRDMRAHADNCRQYTTVLHRWFEAYRSCLMPSVTYVAFERATFQGLIPKINTQTLSDAMTSLARRTQHTLEDAFAPAQTKYVIHFKKTAYNWLNFCTNLPPCFDAQGSPISHTKFGEVWLSDAATRDILLTLLNGKIMFAFWCMVGDDFDVTRWMFADFPFDLSLLADSHKKKLIEVNSALEACMCANASFKLNAGKRVGNYNLAKCRAVTARSDEILAHALGLSQAWEDIELMYCQVVKTDFGNEE